MDIVLETKSYRYNYDTFLMGVIDLFLMNILHIKNVGTLENRVFITRKEVEQLEQYIRNYVKEHNDSSSKYILNMADKIHNMWLVMEGKEKCEIHWY